MDAIRMMTRAAFALGLLVAAAAAQAQEPKPDVDAGAVLLVALKHFDGSPYHRTVVLAAPRGNGWHVGVVLNRPTESTLAELFPDHAPSRAVRHPVHLGGLWHPEAIFALVRAGASPGPKSTQMLPGVWLVRDEASIDRIIEKTPNAARYYAGAIAWGPFRLREQIEKGELAVLPADEKLLFLEDTSKLYDELARRAGAIGTGLRVRF